LSQAVKKEDNLNDTSCTAVGTCGDITRYMSTPETNRHQKVLMDGINRILQEALTCDTEEELGKICLSVAVELTRSQYGFIAEINSTGYLRFIAKTYFPEWDSFRVPYDPKGEKWNIGLKAQSLYGRVLLEGKPLFTNDPAIHPDSVGIPKGHPPLHSFLGAPLIQCGETFGLVALANGEGGYSPRDVETLETLTRSIVPVLMRKRAENRLRLSEEIFFKAFHQSPIIMAIYRISDGIIIDVNYNCAKALGTSRETMLGKSVREMGVWVDPEYRKEIMRRLSENGYVHSLEIEFRYESGKTSSNLLSINTIEIEGEMCLLISSIDITDRKKAEEALMELSRQQFYKAFYNNQNIMSIVRTEDGFFVDVNTVCGITGYKREEIIGRSLLDLTYLTREEGRSLIQKVRETGCIRNFEMKLRKKSGGTCYTINTLSLIDVAGEECLIISTMDITERKKLEDDLRESRECFYKIFDNSPDIGCVIRMEDNRFIEVNQNFSDILGYTRMEIIYKTLEALEIEPLDQESVTPFYEKLKEHKKLVNLPVRCRAKSGETIFALCSTETLFFKGQEHRLVFLKDITKEMRLEAEMAHLDRLHLVGEMAAAIGHEVRNPMTTVRGFLQLFRNKPEFQQYNENLTLMIEELDRANAIITEFLALARNKKLDKKREQLNKIIQNLFPLLQADAMKNDKYISVDLSEIPELLLDEKEIRQLLHNLVRNALEAMDPGGCVTLRTSATVEEVILEVHDEGPGIPSEVLPRLGTPFFTTKESGTGMGLAICYSIAERHNAKIDVESGPGGTTFFVRFKVN